MCRNRVRFDAALQGGLERHDVMLQAQLVSTPYQRTFASLQGLLAVPAVVSDAIACDDSAGAVCAAVAVYKDRILRIQEREDFAIVVILAARRLPSSGC